MADFAALRQRMVDNQLRTSEVTDRDVIRAFLTVPREIFAAPAERPFAYADRELRMAASAPDRRMMDPVRLARLIHALPRGPEMKAMVVGCGSGYSAAILARLVGSVVAARGGPCARGAGARESRGARRGKRFGRGGEAGRRLSRRRSLRRHPDRWRGRDSARFPCRAAEARADSWPRSSATTASAARCSTKRSATMPPNGRFSTPGRRFCPASSADASSFSEESRRG